MFHGLDCANRENCHSTARNCSRGHRYGWTRYWDGRPSTCRGRSFGCFGWERAERRYKENVEKGITADLGIVEKKKSLNGTKDSHRAVSPLQPAADAIHFDTTGVGIADVVAFIEKKEKTSWQRIKNWYHKSWEKQKWELLALWRKLPGHGSSFSNEIHHVVRAYFAGWNGTKNDHFCLCEKSR